MADETKSILPYGTTVEISQNEQTDIEAAFDQGGTPATMIDISAVTKSFSMSGAQADEISDDSFASAKTGFKSYKQGLKDTGTISFNGYFTPGSTEHATIKGAYNDGKIRAVRVTLPNAVAEERYLGFVRTYSHEINLDGTIAATIEIRLTGTPVEVIA